MDFFFVLSGFLITGILYDTLDEPHFFRTFYIRRALRIFPLYWGFFAVLACAAVFTHFVVLHRYFWSWAFYVGNLGIPFEDIARGDPASFSVQHAGRLADVSFGYFWSLCVEEQFYLLWPLIVYSLRGREKLMRLAVIISLLTLLLRGILFYTLPRPMIALGFGYFQTYTRWDELLVGAWLALWLRGVKLTRSELRAKAYLVGIPCTIALAIGAAVNRHRFPDGRFSNSFQSIYSYSLIGIVAACVVLLCMDDSSAVSRCLRWRPLAELGKVSYGFYLLHGLILFVLVKLLTARIQQPAYRWAAIAVGFSSVYALAKLSFTYYEKPILALKARFAPTSHPNVPA